MRTSATGIWSEGGFTLLEIMVVLLIIGITMGMALVSVGSQDREQRVRNELSRMRGLFDLAAQESVLQMREWGVRLSGQGYEFLVQDEGKRWRKPDRDERLLKVRSLPPDLPIRLWVEGQEVGLADGSDRFPQLLFSADGRMTPFQLELTVLDASRIVWRLSGGLSGGLRLERVVGE